LAAFAVFCVLCGLTAYAINYFLFQSTVPMQVALDVGRGTAAYLLSSDPDENVAPQDGHFIAPNERIRLDSQSQSTIFFRDTYHDNRLVAAVTMKGGTSLYLGYALRPRFEWSSIEYRIDLSDVSGEVEVYVPPGLDRKFWLSLKTAQDAFVYLTESGSYTVNASSTQVQVFNTAGSAFLIAPGFNNPRLVSAGERGVMILDGTNDVALAPGPLALLQSSTIQTLNPHDALDSNQLLADLAYPWQCGDSQSEPPGFFGIGVPDGRPAIRLYRDNADTHGETSCSQSPGPGQLGRDVSGFSSLVLKATFFIEHQSLLMCGYDGSECPMMVQLDYVFVDESGTEQLNRWFHGFYANTDPGVVYPTRCSSCLVDHDSVYPGTWYIYESANLFTLIPAAQRPTKLLRVRFYASGHEYDVYVGDVALYAS
jgi:hypothetical protein